jgi:hypothetical protein
MINKQTLYINETSINNNKYFKTHKDLLALSNKEIKEIKEYKQRTGYLKNTNKKLGRGIYAFDLPAVVSCPDSDKCFNPCYANKGTFLFKSTKRSNTYNYAIALHDLKYLQEQLINEINKKKIKVIRIHSSGDFYSKEYFLMWCNIAEITGISIFTYSKAPQIEGIKVPGNLNIINSFINYNDEKILNFGAYQEMKDLAKNVKGLLCPITKGQYLDNKRLQPPEFTCSVCKYCITKNKPTFVAH